MNASQRKYAFPEYSLAGLDVLDIGCGTGYAFGYPHFAACRSLHGIDVDREAIAAGRVNHPKADLCVGCAEHLPYDDQSFDVVMSRVALPYTHIPRALAEIHRVLRPKGRIYLTMHDWKHQLSFMRPALTSPKRMLDLTYVLWKSALFNLTGACTPRFWNSRYETIQTVSRMKRCLQSVGFSAITHQRTWQFIFEAQRVPAFETGDPLAGQIPERPVPSMQGTRAGRRVVTD